MMSEIATLCRNGVTVLDNNVSMYNWDTLFAEGSKYRNLTLQAGRVSNSRQ
jgi:hypothetical protein